MSSFAMLKRNSKLALKGSWGRAILVLLIPAAASLLSTALGALVQYAFFGQYAAGQEGVTASGLPLASPASLAVSIAFAACGFLLLSPLRLGVAYWFYNLVYGKSLPAGRVFYWFDGWRQYLRAMNYSIHIMARSLFWAMLFMLVPVTLSASSILVLTNGGDRTVMAVGTVGITIASALTILAETLCVIYLNRYLLSGYLLCEDDSASVRDAFKTSAEYTRGHRFQYFLYTLSFLGWILLSVLTLGLFSLYTAPYLFAASAMYGRYVTEQARILPDVTKEFTVG